MAGFMSGFGQAFSRSFENQRDRQERRDADEFKYKFQTYLDEKDKWETEKQKDEFASSTAKALLGDNTSEEAYSYVYKMIRSGVDPKIVKENLDQYDIVGITPDKVETPDKPSVDDQMKEVAPPAEDIKMNPVKRILNPEAGQRDYLNDKSINRIADITGDKPEDVRKVFGGMPTKDKSGLLNYRLVPKTTTLAKKLKNVDYEHLDAEMQKAYATGDMELYMHLREAYMVQQRTDNALSRQGGNKDFTPMIMFGPDEKTGRMVNKGTVSWNGVYVRQSGKEGDIEISALDPKVMFVKPEDVDSLTADLNKYIAPTLERAQGLREMAVNIASVDEILNRNPYAGTGIAKGINTLKQGLFEADAMSEIIRNLGEDGQTIDGMTFSEAEAKLTEMLNDSTTINGVKMDSGAKALANIQIAMTFDFMRAKGQTGNAVSTKEFDAAFHTLFQSKRREDLMPHLRILFEQEFRKYSMYHRDTQRSLSTQSIAGTYWFNESPNEYMQTSMGDEYYNYMFNGGANPEIKEQPVDEKYQVGETVTRNGQTFKFLGGNWRDQNNWEKVE